MAMFNGIKLLSAFINIKGRRNAKGKRQKAKQYLFALYL
jgi:hypothetical protein